MSERKNKGLLFKFLSFTNIAKMYNSIAIFIDGELVTEGTVGDVLMHLSKTDTIMVKNIEHNKYAIPNYEIESCNVYFDQFVIRLLSNS